MSATEQTAAPPQPWVPDINFGTRLLVIRKTLGLSCDQMAANCGLSGSSWFTWEKGAMPRDQVDVVNKVAAATGVDRNWLMFGNEYSVCITHDDDASPSLFAHDYALAS